jgi:hypothetical protein
MFSRYLLVSALTLQTALPAYASDNQVFYRYTSGIISDSGPNDPGPTDPGDPTNPTDPDTPASPDIADQSRSVLGTTGTAIANWLPKAAAGWASAVVDRQTRAAWGSSGLVFSTNYDLAQYGLSFSSQNGRISGTPNQAFVLSDFRIIVSENGETDTTAPFWLGVIPANSLSLVQGQTSSYTVRAGTPYTTNAIQVSNAVGTLNFSKPATIPAYAWDSLTGALTWVRSDAGSDTFNTVVTDEFDRSAPFSFNVNYLPALSVNQLAQVDLIGTLAYNDSSIVRQPTAEGVLGAATWDVFDTPAGINFDIASGVISGTVANSSQQGEHNVTLLVVDDTDYSNAFGQLTINVLPPFQGQSFGTATMKQGADMTPVSFNLRDRTPQGNPYTGGGITWSRISGSIPPGIQTSGSGSQFTFSGKATAQGTFTSVWQARDANGWRFTLDPITFVVEPRDPLSINIAQNYAAVGRQTYTTAEPLVTPTANNIVGTATWSATGLPTGLSIDPTTGVITGSITNGAAYQGETKGIGITVTDSADNTSISNSFDLVTSAPFSNLTYTPPTLKVGVAMTAGGFNLRNTSNAPYTGFGVTAAIFSGALPAGISATMVNDQLQFSGTATTQGTANVIYKLTDAQGWNITLPRIFWSIQN